MYSHLFYLFISLEKYEHIVAVSNKMSTSKKCFYLESFCLIESNKGNDGQDLILFSRCQVEVSKRFEE